MNCALPGDRVASVPGSSEAVPASMSVAVLRSLTNGTAPVRTLEDWLAELAEIFAARHAALVAFRENEPIVGYFFPPEAAASDNVNWPWRQGVSISAGVPATRPAQAAVSADGQHRFLWARISLPQSVWVLCLEDRSERTWSEEEQAALTLAALGVFPLLRLPESTPSWTLWSERAQARERLEDAARVAGRLVHDFNNVLTSVMGFTELSLTQLTPGSTPHHFMSDVYTAAQQGTQMIQQVSLFSARKATRPGLQTSLSLLLNEEEKRWRKAWGEAVALEVIVPRELPELAIDADSLRLLLHKLLDNAREAIPATGGVILSARTVELTAQDVLGLLGSARPGSYIEISVADTGTGFSAEARQRVLVEPFFSGKPGHRGLGLAAVYGIVSNHGGGLHLEHSSGQGTLVRIYLPTAHGTAAADSRARSGARPARSPEARSGGSPLAVPGSALHGNRRR